MTDDEKLISYETLLHIKNVNNLLITLSKILVARAIDHDTSKLGEIELPTFVKFTPLLAGSTYGSIEYIQFLKDMKPALDHHYEHNRHHPEYFENGINGMDLIDLIEMLCDWKAATMRHNDGDIQKSISINTERFGISDQLVSILKNTIKYFDKKD